MTHECVMLPVVQSPNIVNLCIESGDLEAEYRNLSVLYNKSDLKKKKIPGK